MRRWFHRDIDFSDPAGRVDQVLAEYQTEIAGRLEIGLREIQDRTVSLIRDIAKEVWSSDDVDADLQERVLSVLSRDAAVRGLIAHTDERYQALDIRVSGLGERLQGVTQVTEELRDLLARTGEGVQAGTISLDDQGAELLHQRMAALQRYLASVMKYEAERDRAISEWLQRMFVRGQDVIREEAARVIGEVGADVDVITEDAATEILSRLDLQTRALSLDMASQEARIRLSVSDGQQDQADILTDQLRVLESIETDLTTELDERLARLAEMTGAAATWAVDEVAERVGRQSTEAVTLGMKDLLAVIDRRFAWLEETIQDRLSRLERSLGVEPTVIPDSAPIEVR